MLKLVRTKQFKKDLKKVVMSDTQYQKFILYLSRLINGDPLPPEALDHPLQGNWKDTREFHVGGDLLVIYRKDGQEVQLIRIGTHSELFK